MKSLFRQQFLKCNIGLISQSRQQNNSCGFGGLNTLPHNPDFYDPKIKPFENLAGKGENAGNQHFLLFPQCFLPFPKQISFFSAKFNLLPANAFNLDQSKICRLVKS